MNHNMIETVCAAWSDPATRPLFKGKLIDGDGCCCAQGDVLRRAGRTDDELRAMEQNAVDHEIAKLLGISVAHSILLRQINDRADGCPQDVLLHPERVLGDQAQRVLAFWRRLDAMTPTEWAAAWAAAGNAAWAAAGDVAWAAARDAARNAARNAAGDVAEDVAGNAAWAAAGDVAWAAARNAAGDAAWAAAWAAARNAAGNAAGDAAWAAAGDAAWASNEIQGAKIMKERGQPFFFLPLFGISDPAELDGWPT